MTAGARPLKLVTLIVVLVVFAAACTSTTTVVASGPQRESTTVQFEATPVFLASAKLRVDSAASKRFELFTEIDSTVLDLGSRNEPLLRGESAQGATRVDMDLAQIMGPFGALGVLDEEELTSSSIIVGDVLYLHAPVLAWALGLGQPIDGSDGEWASVMAQGWGRVDLNLLTDSPDVQASLALVGAADPAALLAILEAAAEVVDGGSGEVRGVRTRIALASVTLQDLVAAAGQSFAQWGSDNVEAEALAGLMSQVEVHVDDEGLIRRFEYSLDLGSLAPQESGAPVAEVELWQRIDFFDYADAIEVTPPEDAVDVTEEFRQMFALDG